MPNSRRPRRKLFWIIGGLAAVFQLSFDISFLMWQSRFDSGMNAHISVNPFGWLTWMGTPFGWMWDNIGVIVLVTGAVGVTVYVMRRNEKKRRRAAASSATHTS